MSELVSGLEGQVGVMLFDRTGRTPRLTDAGTVLLGDARAVIGDVDVLKARAKGISSGVEPELSAVIDVFFPMRALTDVAREFRDAFPHTPLWFNVEALGGVVRQIVECRASVGVVAPLPKVPAGLTVEHLGAITLVHVAGSEHPQAKIAGQIPTEALSRHLQIVLTDRTDFTQGLEMGVLSQRTWRIADLYAKHSFLLNGFGWGGMQKHVVEDDLANGRLVELQTNLMPPGGHALSLQSIYFKDSPPGLAARWLVSQLRNRLTEV